VGDPEVQGWYVDPYHLHECRYFSSGNPTKLVRDGVIESYDEPPNYEPIGPIVPVESDMPSVEREGYPEATDNQTDVIEAFIVTGRTAPKRN
jgi:hypothetical protein